MRMTTAMFERSAATVGLMSLLWMLYALMIPSSSHAALFFDTDFETCTTETGNDFPCEGWDDFGQERTGIPPNIQSGVAVVQSSVAAFSGSKGFRGIHDGKGTLGVQGGNTWRSSIYHRTPPSSKHIFARWAFREAPGFEYCAINGFTKLVRFVGDGYPKVWIMNRYGTFSVVVEGPYDATGTTDLYNTGIVVSTSAWQQLEFEWKMNTPGQYDGHMRFWINGTMLVEKLNRAWVGPTPTSPGLHHSNITPSNLNIDTMQLYMQCGLGTMYYDRVAVGNTRIGLLPSQPGSDSRPPASPQGLQAR